MLACFYLFLIYITIDKDDTGMTVEGLQEWYDEACLIVHNNKFQDGVQWHDEPCFKRYPCILIFILVLFHKTQLLRLRLKQSQLS